MSDGSNDHKKGIGCILTVIAIIILITYFKVQDNLIDWLNRWFETH